MNPQIPIPEEAIATFCRKWSVQEFSLFGSVLRPDFGPKSDLDVLVAFSPNADGSIEAWVAMQDELKAMFGREIDLVERRLVTNPFRRHHILTNRQVVYAA